MSATRQTLSKIAEVRRTAPSGDSHVPEPSDPQQTKFSQATRSIMQLHRALSYATDDENLPDDLRQAAQELQTRAGQYDVGALKKSTGHQVNPVQGATADARQLRSALAKATGYIWKVQPVEAEEIEEIIVRLSDDYGIGVEPSQATGLLFIHDTKSRDELSAIEIVALPGGKIFINMISNDRVTSGDILVNSADEFIKAVQQWS